MGKKQIKSVSKRRILSSVLGNFRVPQLQGSLPIQGFGVFPENRHEPGTSRDSPEMDGKLKAHFTRVYI